MRPTASAPTSTLLLKIAIDPCNRGKTRARQMQAPPDPASVRSRGAGPENGAADHVMGIDDEGSPPARSAPPWAFKQTALDPMRSLMDGGAMGLRETFMKQGPTP
eukprot:m.180844 g.180844  ORF g.180844 m.180844 type:complete len:105 (+) comp9992_c0_seq27:796-1110(+)